jgi:hypothetical protein
MIYIRANKPSKILAIFLAVIFVLSLFLFSTSTTWADYTADDQFTVIVSVNNTQFTSKPVKNSAVFFLEYDVDALQYESVVGLGDFSLAGFKNHQERIGNGAGLGTDGPQESSGHQFAFDGGFDSTGISVGSAALSLFSVTFSVKANAEPGQYSIACYASSGGLGADYSWLTTSPSIITVAAVGGGGNTNPVYTIAASSGGSDTADVEVNVPFDVDVILTAVPPTAEYATAEAELFYNPAYFTHGDLPAGVSENTPGTILISGDTGDNAPVSTGVTLATIAFTPTAAAANATATFEVSDDAIVVLANAGEENEISAGTKDLTVTVGAAGPAISFGDGSAYIWLPDGTQLLKYAVTGTDYFYTYNDERMYYITEGGATYAVYIVDAEITADSAFAPFLTSTPYENDGDLNHNGTLRVSDAQIVYDIVHGGYRALEELSVDARLKADINGDGKVTQDDVELIVSAIHNGGDFPQ